MSSLISYDIEDNYLRQKIANYLIDAGFSRLQYSVYMGTIPQTAMQKVIAYLQSCLQQKQWGAQDSILILSITPSQIQSIVHIGTNPLDLADLSGTQNTLIF